jgi:SAM-dependent methyltransferase
MATAPDSDTRAYWEQRLSESDGLAGVGWIGLGESFNRWMYAVRRRVFKRAVRRAAGPRLAGLDVLDVGSGTGFYLDLWQELGARSVTGSDLTEVAVERLLQRRPGQQVTRLDLAGDGDELGGRRFGAVSAMDVLFHIVDDEAYARAISNLARLTAPGGLLILTENLVSGPRSGVSHHVSRTEEQVEGLLRQAGLEPLVSRPMFCLMNTPVDSRSRALRLWWEALSRAASVHDAVGWALGALVYPAELAAVTALRRGPSTKILVRRRAL